MGNLGWYQKITTISKAVGGPKNLIGLLIGGGIAIGTGGTLLTQKVIKAVKIKIKSINISYMENGKVFTVSVDYKDENGLDLKIDDNFKILKSDGDAILIEIIGNNNNPYFVSGELLRKISDYI